MRDPRGRRSSVRPDLEIKTIAAKVGVTSGYVCAILKGVKTPSLKVAESLALHMGFSGVDELRVELEKYKAVEKVKKRKRRVA